MTTGASTGGSGGASGGPGWGVWIGGALVVVALLVVVVVSGRQQGDVAFSIRSSQPAGYRALATLLRDRGATVRGRAAAQVQESPPTSGEVLVVADPDLLTLPELDAVLGAADAGALVVFGTPRTDGPTDPGGFAASAGVEALPARALADTPAEPTRQGECDIARLDGLGPIDTAFATRVPPDSAVPEGTSGGTPDAAEARGCYGDLLGAFVTEVRRGSGSVVVLGSPYLWANARLWPDKENGGEPLDNAAVALRLLGTAADGAGPGTTITFVDAVPTAGVTPDGTRNPMELLPIGVKLGLAQLLAAFALYAWWRSRRLGSVVVEAMPVEIAGSELVVAVGDLLRRRGSPQRAADVLRADARRELARRLGVGPDTSIDTLLAVVSGRSGRAPAEVAAALADGPVGSPDELLRLATALSDIRQEVLTRVVR